MYKNIILFTTLALLIGGCSQTKAEKKVKVVEQNKTIKRDTSSKEFIPKHIRLSHIEVVPH